MTSMVGIHYKAKRKRIFQFVDVSYRAVGAVLSQIDQNGEVHPAISSYCATCSIASLQQVGK